MAVGCLISRLNGGCTHWPTAGSPRFWPPMTASASANGRDGPVDRRPAEPRPAGWTCTCVTWGITPQNRENKIAAAAAHPEVRLHWVETLKERVEHLPEAVPGVTRAAYARLFIPFVLPSGIDRALYLDSDLIVRRCVGEFFDLPMGDLAALGVADAGSPYVSSLYGVPYWSRYGRRADDVNFNSGVLLLNLTAWREEDITGEAVAYLTDGRHQFLVDQEADQRRAALAGSARSTRAGTYRPSTSAFSRSTRGCCPWTRSSSPS